MNLKMPRHRLTSSLFAELCSGPATGRLMKDLRVTQLSHRKLLLASLAEAAVNDASAEGLASSFEKAWDVLAAAERSDASVVEELLLHPSVGVWLARALRAAAASRLCRADVGYLSSMAVAAAVRCRISCALEIPVVHGAVTLPTVGQVVLVEDSTVDAVEVAVSAVGEVALRGGAGHPQAGRSWSNDAFRLEPVKVLECRRDGVRLRTELDDRGPYREFTDPIPPRPLGLHERGEWEKQIGDAWSLLVEEYRGFAEELSEGVSAIVPFGAGTSVAGASSSVAYGAIAVSRKKSAFELAEALIHEMQHSKLNALFDFAELCVPGTENLGYAPWRDDPRPTGGLLHGVFAFTTAVEFWRRRRDTDGPARRAADFHYGYRRWQVRQTLESLAGAADLTDLGRRFVELVSERLDLVEHDDVSGTVLDAIGKMTREHRAFWRAQHLRPDPGWVTGLAEAWAAGDVATTRPQPLSEVIPCQRSIPPSPRVGMLKALLLDGADPAEHGGASSADLAYVRGDLEAAHGSYEEQVRSNPADDRAWLAFGLAGVGGEGGNALVRSPETVLAVRDRLLAGGVPIDQPLKLVTWLDPALR